MYANGKAWRFFRIMKRWALYLAASLVGLMLVAIAFAGVTAALIYPTLPSLEALTDYRPKEPLRIYSEEGVLLAEFGEERRAVVRLADTPPILRQAILAAEDERFYQHGGVDTIGVVRAALSNLLSREVREGASTITMQVARNFFLSSEKTFRRKINEAMLAFKIEHTLSKDQILELYINQIYLGQRAYGFAAAAQIYFGKPLSQIDLAEAAMLAGLPKAPSAINPVVNPARARARQHYVLRRMHELGHISAEQMERARAQVLKVRQSAAPSEAAAGYVAEMARQYVYQKYGEQSYFSGMRVYTTIRVAEQKAAEDAVRAGVVGYNRRRGYAGPEGEIELPAQAEARREVIDRALASRAEINGLIPAVVLAIDDKHMRVRLRNGSEVELGASEVRFARAGLTPKSPPSRRIKPGSIVRVVRLDKDQPWQLTYLPNVEAALVALSPEDGAIRALVGGFDFSRNQFNRVVQAWRQPGSAFKPFIYSAALERGVTPASVFEDAPLEIDPALTGGQLWSPKNYDGRYEGPMTVRQALAKSKNLVAIRVLQAAGVEFAREHALRFGFTPNRIPPYLTLALGAGEVTPLQLASAYAVFANGGRLVRPYFLTRITDKHGRVLESFQPSPPQPVLDPRNAYVMTSLMQDVVRRGTATAALRLGRSDLAGKTGTTNDHRDAWFAGYTPHRVAVAWIGFDQPRPLGGNETGGVAALPMWIRYMAVALARTPDVGYPVPAGVVTLPTAEDGRAEVFFEEFKPLPAENEPGADADPAELSPPAVAYPVSSEPRPAP